VGDRREVVDAYLRDRAVEFGATAINGLVTDIVIDKDDINAPYIVKYSNYDGKKTGTPEELEVDLIVGADGANSRVAKAMDAGEYNYAIAFQERIRIDDEKMAFYENLAEMYVGDDVSPPQVRPRWRRHWHRCEPPRYQGVPDCHPRARWQEDRGRQDHQG